MPSLKSKKFIIQYKLLRWFKKNQRILPWRTSANNNLPNPYYVMVSEFMLQQTTVNSVISKFNEFIQIWPNLKKLSAVNENEILQFWSGLGYYIRAKNLFKSTKIITEKYNSIIPDNYHELIKLPGVGDYTAKAILGIGFNQSVMPVDANIERILARLYGLKKPIILIKKNISSLAESYISKKQSSNLIQAFMDYGSIICMPRNPKCNVCEIAKECVAYKKNLIHIIPKKKKSTNTKIKKYTRAYIIINHSNEILVRRRSPKGMLPSMVEIPNDKWVTRKKLLKKDNAANFFKNKLNHRGSLLYSFSHFNLEVDIFLIKSSKKKIKNHKWILLNNISSSGMPTIMKKIVAKVK